MASVCQIQCALLVGSLALTASQGSEQNLPSFASFIAQHSRVYKPGTEEYELRHAVYKERVANVKAQNSNPERLWNAGVNHLTDRTEAELAELRGWRGFAQTEAGRGRAAQISRRRSGLFLGQSAQMVIPEAISWGNLSTISEAVNQYACGSCWAIAAATVLNAAAERAGTDRTFSAQDLVSCVPNPHRCGGTGGCSGATVELAMAYSVHKGVRTKFEAPYHGVDGFCSSSDGDEIPQASLLDETYWFQSKTGVGVHHAPRRSPGREMGIRFWERLPENEQRPLMAALVRHGPLAVSVAASSWGDYSSGVFNACNVDAIIDHAVTLFGYGVDTDRGVKFWEIKNSWGAYWGEQGNIRLLRTDEVSCGIDNQPEVGTGCEDGPSQVKVCGMCGILYDSIAVQMH